MQVSVRVIPSIIWTRLTTILPRSSTVSASAMLSPGSVQPAWLQWPALRGQALVGQPATEEGVAPALTSTGIIVGTPHYMSPEQTLGQPDLDFRTDVYALGITTYHALTGVTPYAGPNVAAVLARKLSESIPDPRDIRADLPPAAASQRSGPE